MMPSRTQLFGRLEQVEEKQRALWVAQWKPLLANIETLTDEEEQAGHDTTTLPPELVEWVCEPLDTLEPEHERILKLEGVWYDHLHKSGCLTPGDGPNPWNFEAPVHPLKSYMPAEICEHYKVVALLHAQHAPSSPDPARLLFLAAGWRWRAKWARGYAGLRPWNDWDWKRL